MDEEVELSDENDQTFPDLSNEHQIRDLRIKDNPDLTTFRTLPPNLNILLIDNCENLLEIPDLPDSVYDIKIEDCGSLRRIPLLRDKLQSIAIVNCASLREIPDLPDSLKHIYIEKCDNLRRITIFPGDVQNIGIHNCASLEAIPDLPTTFLTVINIDDCESLRRIPALPRDLESFSVTNLPSLEATLVLPPHLAVFNISGCPLAMIQELPASLAHFICDIDQLDELCKNKTFLDSIMYLLEHDDFVISRPGKNTTDEEKQVFTEKIREIKRYKKDTKAGLIVSFHGQSSQNISNPAKKAFDKVGSQIIVKLNPYDDRYNESLVENAKRLGQSIVDRREASEPGSASASYLKVEGGKSKKQKKFKKSRNKRHKHTKKRRRTTKKRRRTTKK
jgi:hypothetical protein